MAWPKIEEIRSLDDSEISQEILRLKRELLELRMQKATGKLEKPHSFKVFRRHLSQLMTVQRERDLSAVSFADKQEEE